MKKAKIRWASALVVTAVAAGCMTSPAPDGRECFLNRNINGFAVLDDHTVQVSVGASRRYNFTTDWNVRDLNWSERIAVRSTSGWICVGDGLGIDVISGRPPRTYPVRTVAAVPQPEKPRPAS